MRQFEPEKKSTIKRAFEKDESLVASKLGFDNEKIEVRKEKSQSSKNDDRNRHLNYHSQSWDGMGKKSGTVGLRKNNFLGKSGSWLIIEKKCLQISAKTRKSCRKEAY